MTGPPGGFRSPSADFGRRAGSDGEHYLAELFRGPLDPGYADAAEARRRTGAAPPGWRSPMRAAALVTLLVIGMVFAVAYQRVVAEEPTRSQVRADLEEQIRERDAVADQLQDRADALREEVSQLRDRELDDPQAQQLRELEAATGFSRVSGNGAVVRVDDGPPEVDPATGAEVVDPEARILDLDLQRIANGLWAAGAEAIAINDRRLTSTSTIRSASGAILVDRVPVVGPYEVVAIGDDDLAERFAGSATGHQLQRLVDDFGITYEVRAERDLTLPAATTAQLYHATPAGGNS